MNQRTDRNGPTSATPFVRRRRLDMVQATRIGTMGCHGVSRHGWSGLGWLATVVRGAVLIVLVQTSTSTASAQGPWQRLGDRLRARLATPAPEPTADFPVSPPTAGNESVPGVGVAIDGPGPGTGMIPRSSNFNRAESLSGRDLPQPAASANRADSPNAESGAWINRQNAISVAAAEAIPPPVTRSRLGVVVASPPEESRPGLPPRRPRGAWVSEVLPKSAAEVAGLTAGDLLIAIDGRLIHTVPDLLEELKRREAGDRVRLAYSRNSQLRQAVVTLAGPDGLAAVGELAPDQPRASDASPDAAGSGSMLRGFGSMLGGLLGSGTEPESASSEPAVKPGPAAGGNRDSEPDAPNQD